MCFFFLFSFFNRDKNGQFSLCLIIQIDFFIPTKYIKQIRFFSTIFTLSDSIDNNRKMCSVTKAKYS